MATSTFIKPFSKLVTGATIATGIAFASAGAANAAMFAVGDAGHSGTGGENTLSNLGFNMESVTNDPSVSGQYTPLTLLDLKGARILRSMTQLAAIGLHLTQ